MGSAAVVDGGRITPSPVEGFPPPCMVPPGPSQSIEGSCGLVGELTMGALSVSSVEAVGRFPLFAPDVDAAELLSVVWPGLDGRVGLPADWLGLVGAVWLSPV